MFTLLLVIWNLLSPLLYFYLFKYVRRYKNKEAELNLVSHGRVVTKPWGSELIWAETKEYAGKILYINRGQKLSKQYHIDKDETIYLQRGSLELELEKNGVVDLIRMSPGDSYHITPYTIHRMVAVTDCEVLEVSTSQLKDVVRLEDKYGRA
jgi:quercetin dioxygenase-like cupin family protein